MQVYQNKLYPKFFFLLSLSLVLLFNNSIAQVNTVEFGKNRLQFKKFKWKYYQTPNFNTYFYENGQPIAKYVAQLAEKELPSIEQFVEYGLQRRANLAIYNSFNDMEQSNIGLSLDWQTTGGITKLVNNKVVLYSTDDYNKLRIQVRQGIARILVENILFGDDLGEFAANQALLDLPQWLTDGYIEYVGENWSTDLDDQLKSAVLSGRYTNFYQFAFEKPNLAGHAFWYYLSQKYKKENVTYFLYLARVYRNLNSASQRICKKKFKEVLKDFMEQEELKYSQDVRGRRNFPKGTVSVVETINPNKDFFHFAPNPQPKSQTYAVVEFDHGQYCVVLHENFIYKKVLYKSGIRTNDNQRNPHYPLIAWDGKGTRLAVVYWEKGKTRLFVYDLVQKYKPIVQDLDMFDQVQDMKYMLNNNTLLLSAVQHGQSDIFVYNMEKQSAEQITNDVYNDLDATFVSFPGKTGIIFSSNRPTGNAVNADTVLPSNNHYNIFLVDNWNKSEFKQISQLTHLKYGDARYPTQYNNFHFTFISNENGVANRFAGLFTTRRAGIDTVYKIGDEVLRNPDARELDSVLIANKKTEPDTMYAFSITNDSSYIFPITNYQSDLKETRIAGDNGQVSEVRQEGDLKFLYKLKVDEAALKKRNINPNMTDYRKQTVIASQLKAGQTLKLQQPNLIDSAKRQKDFFESEFKKEKPDTTSNVSSIGKPIEVKPVPQEEPLLKKAKLLDYKLKFSVDNFTAGFNNDLLINIYQPYTGSLPINSAGQDPFNGMLKASVFDLFEDIRFTGAMSLPLFGAGSTPSELTSTSGNTFSPSTSSFFNGGATWYARIDYLKKMFDFSLIYYRQTQAGYIYINKQGAGYDSTLVSPGYPYNGRNVTNLYQGVIKYPFDKVRSLRLILGAMTNKWVLLPVGDPATDLQVLQAKDLNKKTYANARLEYVFDNTVLKTTNIWNGLRYKAYIVSNLQVNKPDNGEGRKMFNFGFDARNYYPIYRNLIWAVRAAGDFSWGNQKVIYYLGGSDGWLFPKAYNTSPAPDNNYAYQALAVNLRGFRQNVANGNNNVIINSEFRLPVFSTLFNKPINNAFLRNFQVIQFFDLGTAWNGNYNKIQRPSQQYTSSDPTNPITVLIKAGGIGPFAGGYGFGARSTLLGYFLRCDVGWQMNSFFGGKPVVNVSMGVDF